MSTVLNDIWKKSPLCKISDQAFADLMGHATTEVFCPRCERSKDRCVVTTVPLMSEIDTNRVECQCGWKGIVNDMVGILGK